MHAYSLNRSRLLSKHFVSLFFTALIGFSLESCNTVNEVPPMTAEDQIENSGDPIKFLAGEYFTHEVYKYGGDYETSIDPDGYGGTVYSRYFLTLAAKGKDSLTVFLKGNGQFKEIAIFLGTFAVTPRNGNSLDYKLVNASYQLAIGRLAEWNNTLYMVNDIHLKNDKGDNLGYIEFRRVSKGVVRK